mgnify:CR=1 FL=1
MPEQRGRHQRRPRRVLLVEDEVVLRMSTTDMLEQLGCFVAGVGSGEQALELLAQGGSFDLLVTDLGLPGMSGEELAARGPPAVPKLPVVIASGYGRSGMQGEGLQFISSPIPRSICSRRSTMPGGWRRLPDSSRGRATRGSFVAFLRHNCSLDGVTPCERSVSQARP